MSKNTGTDQEIEIERIIPEMEYDFNSTINPGRNTEAPFMNVWLPDPVPINEIDGDSNRKMWNNPEYQGWEWESNKKFYKLFLIREYYLDIVEDENFMAIKLS